MFSGSAKRESTGGGAQRFVKPAGREFSWLDGRKEVAKQMPADTPTPPVQSPLTASATSHLPKVPIHKGSSLPRSKHHTPLRAPHMPTLQAPPSHTLGAGQRHVEPGTPHAWFRVHLDWREQAAAAFSQCWFILIEGGGCQGNVGEPWGCWQLACQHS